MFAVLFCLAIYYYVNPSAAIFLVVLYVILLLISYYIYRHRLAALFATFNSDLKPCLKYLTSGFTQYIAAQEQAINDALC